MNTKKAESLAKYAPRESSVSKLPTPPTGTDERKHLERTQAGLMNYNFVLGLD